ncbi:hypothetical protein ACS0TY_017837 [Phlomoides rotata]
MPVPPPPPTQNHSSTTMLCSDLLPSNTRLARVIKEASVGKLCLRNMWRGSRASQVPKGVYVMFIWSVGTVHQTPVVFVELCSARACACALERCYLSDDDKVVITEFQEIWRQGYTW